VCEAWLLLLLLLLCDQQIAGQTPVTACMLRPSAAPGVRRNAPTNLLDVRISSTLTACH